MQMFSYFLIFRPDCGKTYRYALIGCSEADRPEGRHIFKKFIEFAHINLKMFFIFHNLMNILHGSRQKIRIIKNFL